MKDEPLISCLCVTRQRVPLLKRAIRCFQDQNYGNKELVIVYESDDKETKEFLEALPDENILKVESAASDGLTLGELRTLAVEQSRGEYFCQWDDDDFFHRERLSFQMEVLRESSLPACVMMCWLIYDQTNAEAYVSNMRSWEGSILCNKSLYGDQTSYESKSFGEDTALVKKLFSENLVFPVVMPKLYIYVYHGANVWTKEHWSRILNASNKLTEESSKIIGDILDGKYTGDQASAILDEISE